ncbi:alpha/beta hydrolase [Sphingomonas sp. HH69]|nr:hydrolase [Sphingomonas sp.]
MTQLPSNFIATCGYRTHYIEMGEGKPLILIHGGGAGADARGNWEKLCMPLLAKDRRVIALDMVGFGYSDAPDPEGFDYGLECRVDQLIAFIEAMNLVEATGPVDIIGNSMGGRTTLATAIRRPDLVGDMVLMGSAGVDRSMGGGVAPLTEYDFTYAGMERVVAALTNDHYIPDPDMVRYRLELSQRPAYAKALSATFKALVARSGLWIEDEKIAEVQHRTLVVNGKADKVVPPEHAYKFLSLLTNSTGVILPHCGHWAMIEHPVAFAHITSAFFARKF